MKRQLYFAYGSNLNIEQMRRRCPGARPIAVARLLDHELAFCRVATVVRKRGASVPGAIYSVTRGDVEALDRYEGFPRLYLKSWTEDEAGNRVFFYVIRPAALQPPAAHYLESIFRGYEDWGLDPEELAAAVERSEVGKWATGFSAL